MCGVVGIFGRGNVNQALFDALTVLQHRGQDAAGIVTCDRGKFHLRKDNGLVRDVFRTRHMRYLMGNMGIGHVRYPTAGSSSSSESQPFYVNSPYGISLAHNGNLTNTRELMENLYHEDLRHINTDSDSEVLLNVLAHELDQRHTFRPSPEDFFAAVEAVHRRCRGAYAVVALINGHGILGFRDPHGIRPICIGQRKTERGVEYMIASESVALSCAGFSLIDDLAPGEAAFVDASGTLHRKLCAGDKERHPCLFEYVYLSRPDSVIDGVSVYAARINMGRKLADKILAEMPNYDIDVVIPIPDTSRTAALEVAQKLGVLFREGFIKNRYIGRTFIMPGQTERQKSVRQKLNPVASEFKGRNVLLVDDSIVRGTTCHQIVEMARDAGAKKVYFASAAPAVVSPNVYGIDMPAASELIAHGRTTAQINQLIGADGLIYQELEDLVDAVRELNPALRTFEDSVFSACYLTREIDAAYLEELAAKRNDTAKARRSDAEDASLDLRADVS
ncbi:MAG: amidophosphoribosyltransferase [Litorivicinaceae bacterium]|nr:amidophosphoribosyltransferase [Litorivicinaceae bacterium]MDP5363131.1 amidophosphoribosyltransferase [Litorivicinaceae bacterium]